MIPLVLQQLGYPAHRFYDALESLIKTDYRIFGGYS